MRFSWEHLVAICAAIVDLLLAWFAPIALHMSGANRVILSVGIILIGAAAIVGFLMWARSQKPARPAMPGAPSMPGQEAAAAPAAFLASQGLSADDLNQMIREVESKVSSARLGKGSKIANLRVIFVLGDSASGKTSTVVYSGLDPELLAGQVFQEGAVTPTRSANFWFARQSVLVEAGANILAEPQLWQRLARRLTSQGLGSIFSSKGAGERIAVVCFDCEKIAKATNPETVTGIARALRTRLEELAQAVGRSFPVYVIFTRADKLPFFEDFAGPMSNDEAAQIFGTTLPIAAESPTSVYGERETKRLTAAFTNLFYSLADHRPGLLSRERNAERQPGVYEFPREFRKIVKTAVQTLVELCRPSQLRAGPFLRGFYFAGKREVAANSSPQTVMQTNTSFMSAPPVASNATTMLSAEDAAAAMKNWEAANQAPAAKPEKAKQSAFLTHIFSQIILQDRGAHEGSGASAQVNFWRRALLVFAIVLGVIWITGSVVSFFSNRALESDFVTAAQALHPSSSSGTEPPTLETLQQLDAMRRPLEQVLRYGREGAPLHLRWGLFLGDDFETEARRVYFSRFRQILYGSIRAGMMDSLNRLPATPGPTDEYNPNYDTLKAYLITTSNPEKSSADFLAPVLERYWTAGQNLDPNSRSLARAQFNFFGEELKNGNPYATDIVDTRIRDHARDYLNHFGAIQRIYAAMQNAAAKQNPSLNFYRAHPGNEDLIRNVPEVPGAFTKAGWDFMQNAISHSDQYFKGEEWVLGSANEAVANRADLENQLRSTYRDDFIRRWQDFLKNASVARYGGVEDESRKLKKLSANDSPLLGLFCDASTNTAGRSPDVDKAFQAVQAVVPAPCDSRYITPATQPYIGALAELESCLEGVTAAPPDQKPAQLQQCSASVSKAKLVVAAQIAPALPVDQAAHIDQTVRSLLEQPLGMPGIVVQSGAKGLCEVFTPMTVKYPFNSRTDAPDVSIQDFDAFFKPGEGALSKFVQANQAVLSPAGNQLVVKPGAKVDWAPPFLGFLNRVHFLQETIYGSGAAPAAYKFNVHATLPEGGISGVTFSLNGQTLKYPGGSQSTSFTWPGGTPQEARISYRVSGGQDTDLLSASGPWAILRLMSIPGVKMTPTGGGLSAQWHALQADGRTPLTLSGTGKPIVVQLDFDGGGGPFVFQPANFSGLSCKAVR